MCAVVAATVGLSFLTGAFVGACPAFIEVAVFTGRLPVEIGQRFFYFAGKAGFGGHGYLPYSSTELLRRLEFHQPLSTSGVLLVSVRL